MIRRERSNPCQLRGALSVKTALLVTDPIVTVARVFRVRLRLRIAKLARESLTVTVALPPDDSAKAAEPRLSLRLRAAAIAFFVANDTFPCDPTGVPLNEYLNERPREAVT